MANLLSAARGVGTWHHGVMRMLCSVRVAITRLARTDGRAVTKFTDDATAARVVQAINGQRFIRVNQ